MFEGQAALRFLRDLGPAAAGFRFRNEALRPEEEFAHYFESLSYESQTPIRREIISRLTSTLSAWNLTREGADAAELLLLVAAFLPLPEAASVLSETLVLRARTLRSSPQVGSDLFALAVRVLCGLPGTPDQGDACRRVFDSRDTPAVHLGMLFVALARQTSTDLFPLWIHFIARAQAADAPYDWPALTAETVRARGIRSIAESLIRYHRTAPGDWFLQNLAFRRTSQFWIGRGHTPAFNVQRSVYLLVDRKTDERAEIPQAVEGGKPNYDFIAWLTYQKPFGEANPADQEEANAAAASPPNGTIIEEPMDALR